MIKLVFCLHRIPSLTPAEFQAYWRDHHAPLVRGCAEAIRLKRYVQSHRINDAALQGASRVRGGPDGFDGVAELWFESLADLAATAKDPAAIRAGKLLLEDERKFIHLARSPLFFTTEHLVVGQ